MKIEKTRAQFPLECVKAIIPEQYTHMLPKAVIKPTQKYEVKNKAIIDPRLTIVQIVEEIVKTVGDTIEMKINKILLRHAEEERLKRREKQEKLKDLEVIKAQYKDDESSQNATDVDEKCYKIADEVLDQIIPSIIELLAERDARKFISNLNESIDEDSNLQQEDQNMANKLLREILMPEILEQLEISERMSNYKSEDAKSNLCSKFNHILSILA